MQLRDKLWYLASPYSQYPDGMDAAFEEVCKQAAFLANNGIRTFCPIAHSHPIAKYGNLDAVDHDFWLGWDELFLRKCHGIIVCMMPSWAISKGVTWEIDWMRKQQKPIIYMHVGEVPDELQAK